MTYCETKIDTEFVNLIPSVICNIDQDTVFVYLPDEPALQYAKRIEAEFYSIIKNMQSSKFNVQKTYISYAYSMFIVSSRLNDVHAAKSILDQLVCWIKKSNIYKGIDVGWLDTVVKGVISTTGGIIGGFDGFNGDNGPGRIKTFNESIALAYNAQACQVKPPVFTSPTYAPVI